MTLRAIETLETYTFHDLGSLRDWLNQFKEIDLQTVTVELDGEARVHLHWEQETLSDGSKVINARLS